MRNEKTLNRNKIDMKPTTFHRCHLVSARVLAAAAISFIATGAVNTAWAAKPPKPPPPAPMYTHSYIELGGLGGNDGSAIAINQGGPVVGVATGLAFLIEGRDMDSDQRPDTWYADDDENGVNDLLVDLGNAVGLRGHLLPLRPAGINDAGQVIGTVPLRRE